MTFSQLGNRYTYQTGSAGNAPGTAVDSAWETDNEAIISDQPCFLMWIHPVIKETATGVNYVLLWDATTIEQTYFVPPFEIVDPPLSVPALVTIGPLAAGGVASLSEPATEWYRCLNQRPYDFGGLPFDRGIVARLSGTPRVWSEPNAAEFDEIMAITARIQR